MLALTCDEAPIWRIKMHKIANLLILILAPPRQKVCHFQFFGYDHVAQLKYLKKKCLV